MPNRQNIQVKVQRKAESRPRAVQRVYTVRQVDYKHRDRVIRPGAARLENLLAANATRTALVLGGAETVEQDLALLETLIDGYWPGLVIVVNDMGVTWPRRIDHWVTLHPEKLLTPRGWQGPRDGEHGWQGQRRANGYPDAGATWCHDKAARWNTTHSVKQWGSGSSGLLAVTVAVEHLGCESVVLCGVPMDDRPHYLESTVHDPSTPWSGVRSHRSAWTSTAEQMRGKVFSMSGWTKELLGGPAANMPELIDTELYRAGDTDSYTTPWGHETDLYGFVGRLGMNSSTGERV